MRKYPLGLVLVAPTAVTPATFQVRDGASPMPKRRYPDTTLYHLLVAYADVNNRAAARETGQGALFPWKLPPVTIGHG